ncbi:MAG: UDP-N-acetylmuramoyl-tripeptide--D-alanyl-D-alanine ligase [Nitrospinota bacterium]|nr:UDP-N-acetylmuramoyl-tripeptide--D-alanyl-D-alanine ligase [Nitrospinota bacterium]
MVSDLKTLLDAVQGELLVGEPSKKFQEVSIDSRTLQAGQLFFCIQGDRFDGHDFLAEAAEKKVAGVVVSDRTKLNKFLYEQAGLFAVAVPDTTQALQELAGYHRKQFQVHMIGVTGTNGKSTTKEIIASVLKTRYPTLKTEGNLNNHIGLPLTLLKLNKSHKAAVVEMGMSAAGEIARLAEIALPRIGVITNISQAHMIELKTVKDIQQAKGELFKALPQQGTAIVNADDPLVCELAEKLRIKKITFGIESKADITATDIRSGSISGFDFTLNILNKKIAVHMPLLGRFNIYNALAAAAVGHALDIPLEQIKSGLGARHKLPQRGDSIRYRNMALLNDTYNANPQSMREAMQTLKEYTADGRKFLVIGDMLELGDLERSAHQQLGGEVARYKFDFLVTVGDLARLAGEAALKSGMSENQVHVFDSHQAAVDFLKKNSRPGDCLLFKGSRGAHMETVMEDLMKQD